MKTFSDSRQFTRRRIISGISKLCGCGVGALLLGPAGCQRPMPSTRTADTPPSTVDPTPTSVQASPTVPATPAPKVPTPTPVQALAEQQDAAPPSPTPEDPVPSEAPDYPDLAVARGDDAGAVTAAAIEALGDIRRFVVPGSHVVIKPNICISSPPEYAATTNPDVVAMLVTLCREAGAASIKVLDHGFAGQSTSYARSGIEEAVDQAGGTMVPITPIKWRQTPLPEGKDMRSVEVFDDVLAADVIINVPIAKHHNLAGLTLGMKNLMGVVRDRPPFHANLGQRIADLTGLIRPTLTVIDAIRILTAGGPTGGNLDHVRRMDTIIASPDIVAADAFAATLFGLTGEDIDTIRVGAADGLGVMDLGTLRIVEVDG